MNAITMPTCFRPYPGELLYSWIIRLDNANGYPTVGEFAARYLYYGEVMGPNIPVFEDDTGTPTRFFSPPGQEKHLTGRALTFRMDSNPLAGAFWFERMKADHMQDILEEARNVANGK